jgi:flagellar basal-body rod protein FlgF
MSDVVTANITRQSGLLRELTVIANNIANASTDGYKKEAAIFAEYVKTQPGGPSLSMGALRAHAADLTQGPLTKTGAPLDLAIEGQGWFAVRQGEEVLLTRAGSFLRDGEGRLVTQSGHPVLDEGGAPVELPEDASRITIASDGTVTADDLPVSKIGVLLAQPRSLERAGDNMWRNNGPTRFVEAPNIRQGFLETSNVNAVEEVARLIESQRLYEAGAALQTDEHERLQGLIEALGRR